MTDRWYAIRLPGERWTAMLLPEAHIKHLRPGVQYAGPFDSMIEALDAPKDRRVSIITVKEKNEPERKDERIPALGIEALR